MENILSNIYFNTKNPASFSSAQKLFSEAKKYDPSITLKDVQKWLTKQLTYTLHKYARKNFIRNKIIVKHVDEQWQADLVDMQEFYRQNNGFKYLLTVIDCLSKYAFVQPLKNKNAKSVTSAFEKIMQKGRKCFKLQTDQGKEFLNKDFQSMLEKHSIHHFTSNKNSQIKCAIVERFNRTLKEKMFKYFTAKGTRKYINIIQDLVHSYNNSYHSSIKMRPVSVTEETENEAFCNLYGTANYRELLKFHTSKLKIGDFVRKRLLLTALDKGYYPRWSDEIFKVSKIIKGDIKEYFKIENLDGETINGRFYQEDLQKVEEDLYRIEKVIKTRTRNGIKEYYVKWIGFGNEHNSWVSNIINLQDGSEEQS